MMRQRGVKRSMKGLCRNKRIRQLSGDRVKVRKKSKRARLLDFRGVACRCMKSAFVSRCGTELGAKDKNGGVR